MGEPSTDLSSRPERTRISYLTAVDSGQECASPQSLAPARPTRRGMKRVEPVGSAPKIKFSCKPHPLDGCPMLAPAESGALHGLNRRAKPLPMFPVREVHAVYRSRRSLQNRDGGHRLRNGSPVVRGFAVDRLVNAFPCLAEDSRREIRGSDCSRLPFFKLPQNCHPERSA